MRYSLSIMSFGLVVTTLVAQERATNRAAPVQPKKAEPVVTLSGRIVAVHADSREIVVHGGRSAPVSPPAAARPKTRRDDLQTPNETPGPKLAAPATDTAKPLDGKTTPASAQDTYVVGIKRDAIIMLDGRPARMEDLAVGNIVQVRAQMVPATTARKKDARSNHLVAVRIDASRRGPVPPQAVPDLDRSPRPRTGPLGQR